MQFDRLKDLREDSERKQLEIAKLLRITQQQYSLYETGKRHVIRTFGAEGMGLFQLISPVLALSFSLTVSGIQTAISKYVASETSTRDYMKRAKTARFRRENTID